MDISNSWSFTYLTGHSYRFHWGEGIDFTLLRVRGSPYSVETDLNTYFMTNFTDVRVAINITDSAGNLIDNETLTSKSEDELTPGDNVIYNQTEVREFHYVINGKEDENMFDYTITGWRCVVNCIEAAIEELEISDI